MSYDHTRCYLALQLLAGVEHQHRNYDIFVDVRVYPLALWVQCYAYRLREQVGKDERRIAFSSRPH